MRLVIDMQMDANQGDTEDHLLEQLETYLGPEPKIGSVLTVDDHLSKVTRLIIDPMTETLHVLLARNEKLLAERAAAAGAGPDS